jgi:tetratricopeptide (TPR) repeat protein
MAKQTAQKRKAVGFTAANGPAPNALDVSHVTTFGLIAAGLAITTFGIYAQVIGHHFITIDDLSYIEENPMVNRGITLGGLAWAFTTFHSGNWHPLTWIAHMIDSQFFGIFAGGHLLAVELAPEDAEIRNDLGAVLVRLGRIPEAIDEFHEALRLNPNNAPAHTNLGSVFVASGKAQESIPEFEAALNLNPKSKAAADGLRQAHLGPQR